MGRQIGINLSKRDENLLIEYLKNKFPIIIVDNLYEENWDKQTLVKTESARKWLIFDSRIKEQLIDCCSNKIDATDDDWMNKKWQIRSWNQSCIEWDRKDTIGDRLWIDTAVSKNYGTCIPDEIRKDTMKCFNAASRWIKKNCINTSETRFKLWESKRD